jgi:hypothetical protein
MSDGELAICVGLICIRRSAGFGNETPSLRHYRGTSHLLGESRDLLVFEAQKRSQY